MRNFDRLYDTLFIQRFRFCRLQLITGEPGVIIDHDIDIKCCTNSPEMIHDCLLVRGQIIRKDRHDTICAALLRPLAQFDCLRRTVTTSACINRDLTIDKPDALLEDHFLLFHGLRNIFTGRTAERQTLGPLIDQPGYVFLHCLFVEALVLVPHGKRCRGNAVCFFHNNCSPSLSSSFLFVNSCNVLCSVTLRDRNQTLVDKIHPVCFRNIQ